MADTKIRPLDIILSHFNSFHIPTIHLIKANFNIILSPNVAVTSSFFMFWRSVVLPELSHYFSQGSNAWKSVAVASFFSTTHYSVKKALLHK
jgi:hypothetical protein